MTGIVAKMTSERQRRVAFLRVRGARLDRAGRERLETYFPRPS